MKVNRREFIHGVLAALVYPKALLPKLAEKKSPVLGPVKSRSINQGPLSKAQYDNWEVTASHALIDISTIGIRDFMPGFVSYTATVRVKADNTNWYDKLGKEAILQLDGLQTRILGVAILAEATLEHEPNKEAMFLRYKFNGEPKIVCL